MTEPYLGNKTRCAAVLARHAFVFQKKFGQNFLVDDTVLQRSVATAEVTKDDCVLEIGPGIGTLTQHLSVAAKKVIAVEIDKKLIPILADTLADFPNTEVICNDILKTDIAAIAAKENDGKPMKVVANLPYYITSPIVMTLLEKDLPIESITVMVQKEVAERMVTGPGSKDYGALSLAVQYYTTPTIAFTVPKESFFPMPKVESAVVHLAKREAPPVAVRDEKHLFALVRASFNERRKTLVNGIAHFAGFSYDKETAKQAILSCGFSETVRGEALTLAEFARLSDALQEIAAASDGAYLS